MQLTYRPATAGGWILIARGPGFVVLEPDAIAFIDSVRDALDGDSPVEAVVGALTSDGFARTPSFALVETAGGSDLGDARVIVRGGVDVEIVDGGGSHTVSGTGISTWTERGFTAVSSVTLAVSAGHPVDDVPALVMGSGDAYVATVSLAAVGASDASAAAAAAPRIAAPAPPAAAPAPAAVEEPPASVAEATVASVPDDGDTVVHARQRSRPPAEKEPDPEPAPPLGDHDGTTVLSSDLPKRSGGQAAATGAPEAASAPRLEVSGGATEVLDRPVLVGRAPSVSKVPGGQMPRLVTIGTADHDISRNHAQFTLEGGTVVVTDLHSRNGTLVVLPGRDPQKLRAGEPTAVLIGTVVDFGGGVTVTVLDS